MIRRACTDERVLRERRGQLAESERPAFDAHLSMCESCRNALAVGRAFDASDAPAVDDGTRIRNLARAAEQWAKGGRVPRASGAATLRRRTAVLAAACFLLVAGVATAELGGPRAVAAIVFPRFRRAAEAPPSGPALTRSPAPPRAADAVAVPPSPVVEDDVAPPAPPAPPTAPHHAPPSTARAETAANLFGAANDARRSGDARAATALYRQLQRLFPESAEARLSRVSLGGLLLDEGRAGGALDQFERAVAGSDATLRPEALYGRARALGALHRDGAEVLAWEQLLREFPSCPYADTARRRLDALSQ
jgi:TolA-binding protein